MAYPGTPANLADGDYLPASHLNALAACAEYLRGIGEPSNTGFYERYLTDASTLNYRIRHRHRYLKMRYTSNGNGAEVDYITLKYNGTTVWTDGSPNTQSGYTVVVYLNNTGIITPTPTVGSWYTVTVEAGFYSSGFMALEYLCEQADSASL